MLGVEVDDPAERRRRAGSDWPSIVDVALGEPSVPVTCCWAAAGKNEAQPVASKARKSRVFIFQYLLFEATANGGERARSLPKFASRDNSARPLVAQSGRAEFHGYTP